MDDRFGIRHLRHAAAMNDAKDHLPDPTDGDAGDKHASARLRTISDAELEEILRKHRIWVDSNFQASERADLRNTDLKDRRLAGVTLRRARMQGALLYGADLAGTDLRGANLKDAVGLTSKKLAGANLTGATLPDDIDAFDGLAHATEISKHARNIFLAVIGGCVFSWLAIATTKDAALLTNSASTPLPIIQTKVPIGGFYWAAPVILAALYLYLHFYLQRLWESLGSLPAIFPNGRAIDETAYPWLLISLVRSHVPILKDDRPAFSRLQVLLSVIAAWGLVPATLLLFWLRYMPRHDWFWTRVHIALLALSLAFGVASYLRARATLRRRKEPPFDWRTAWRRPRFLVVNGVAVGVAAVGLLLADGALKGVPPGSDLPAMAHRAMVPKLLRSLGYNPSSISRRRRCQPSRRTGPGSGKGRRSTRRSPR